MLPTLLSPRSWRADPFEAMQRDMGRLFNRLPGDGGWDIEIDTAEYPVDIREDDNNIFVDAEIPGFKKEEVAVTLDNGILNIRAEHKEEKKETKGKQHLQERRYRKIERSFTLPAPVQDQKVDAKLTDGVLHLTLSKTAEAQPKRIEVK